MGEETKETLTEQGNTDPLHATRKPSTAARIDEVPPQVAQMPAADDRKGQKDRHKNDPSQS